MELIEEIKKKKSVYRKKLVDASYFLLIGGMIFIYAIYNVRELLSENYFGIYYYNVPRILSWFFDTFGPIWTTVMMFLLSFIFLGYFLYRFSQYKKNMKELKRINEN